MRLDGNLEEQEGSGRGNERGWLGSQKNLLVLQRTQVSRQPHGDSQLSVPSVPEDSKPVWVLDTHGGHIYTCRYNTPTSQIKMNKSFKKNQGGRIVFTKTKFNTRDMNLQRWVYWGLTV